MKKKLNIYLSFIIIYLSTVNIYGQYELDWAKTYGGSGWDEAYSTVETADGKLLICGYTKAQEKHIWLMEVDKQGVSKFGKTYKTMPMSEAKDLRICRDSGIVMAGYCVLPYSQNSDLWILKLNKFGEKLWYKNYGGNMDEKANSVVTTYDKCIVAAGTTKSTPNFDEDAFIVKVDSSGKLLWKKNLGEEKTDYANAIIETSDNELIMCGTSETGGDAYKSMWAVKLNSQGEEIWNYTFDINKWNYGTAIMQASDGFIYITGYTRTISPIDYDIVVIKIDTDGQLIWKKTFSWGRWDQATSICQTYDNGIVIGGFSRSGKENSSDFAIIKLDVEGNLLWKNVFRRSSLDYSNKVIETIDNGLVLIGTSYMQGNGWDFAVLKYKNNDQSAIEFQQDSVSSSINHIYKLKVCISAKSNLKNIQLYFNGSLFKDKIKRPEQDSLKSGCNIPLTFDLKLVKGENNVELIITDFKNHKTIKSCKIYFAPDTKESW